MKFGRRFRGALEGYPTKWGETAISYRYLKKMLPSVREELVSRGYDPATLRSLLTDDAVEYRLEQDGSRAYHPELSIRADVVDGRLCEIPSGAIASVSVAEDLLAPSITTAQVVCQEQDGSLNQHAGPSALLGTGGPNWIRIHLQADDQFFKLIREDVGKLGVLQGEEQSLMASNAVSRGLVSNDEIVQLRGEISKLSRPRRFSKSDLNRWREIFELYVEAQVFFSTREVDRRNSARTSETARERLVWFQTQVANRNLLQKFKVRTSVAAYSHFLSLNARLLHILGFQELNRTAVDKIIKKFEKHTALRVMEAFNHSAQLYCFMAENVAKNVCAELFDAVLSSVPRLLDYQCTVCWDLSFNPVRLRCNHLFCRQCVVTLQKRNQDFCPLCRGPHVMAADESSVDEQLMAYLEKWFPKEAKGKQNEWEIYRRREELGIGIEE